MNCNAKDTFDLLVNTDYLVRVYYGAGAKTGEYTAWTLTIER